MVRSREWVEKTFGRFGWQDDPGQRGLIKILGDWERRNIVSMAPPFELRDGRGRPLSVIRCHHLVAPALRRVLADLAARSLGHLINTFDGCFVPRHMGWDPARPLSRHAWGIAVDVNARLFPYGSHGRQDERLIGAFARQGFTWGGDWREPDPMHFEVVDLGQPARSLEILVDGEKVAAGFLYEGQAVAPVRPIAEALSGQVEARLEAGEIEIHSPAASSHPSGGER
jgi:hypothetical protein